MNTLAQGHHPAWIEIDLIQFRRNIEIIKNHIGDAKICLPVKANAYGHGLIPIAKAASHAKVDYLGVACLQEGILCREAGIQKPILVFGAIHEDQIEDLLNYELEFTVASLFKAKLVAKQCQLLQKKCKIHIEIETGMQRTGVRVESAKELMNYINSEKCFEIKGVYSHMATSDDPKSSFAKEQIEKFKSFTQENNLKKYPNLIIHLANSGGISYFPNSHFDMVRPGILTFGYFPGPKAESLEGIKPILSVKAKIAYFKVVDANQGISYGHRYTTKEQTRVITVPIGYGDGLRRDLSNRGQVLLHGKKYPIAGTICMDQFMVDIQQNEAYVGDEVVIIGKQDSNEILLEDMAKMCNTITYELLCNFNNRLPRYYKDLVDGKETFFTEDSIKT